MFANESVNRALHQYFFQVPLNLKENLINVDAANFIYINDIFCFGSLQVILDLNDY